MKTITDINPTPSESFKLRNPGLFGKTERFNPQGPALPTASNARTRLDACNKTEMLFYHYLRDWLFDGQVIDTIVQPAKFFELRGGGTYTPDFIVFVHGDLERVHVFEVKGGYRGPGWEQGYERYKRAALEWDGCTFKFNLAEFDRKTQRWTLRGWK